VFLAIHVVAARYVSSNVPYREWLIWMGALDSADLAGWERNHFDRFVHLLFGLLFVLPFADVVKRNSRASCGLAILFAVSAVAAWSAVYEVLEWNVTVVMAPDQAETYNGQQGDHWDPQKDMALAIVGSFVSALVIWLLRFQLWPSGKTAAQTGQQDGWKEDAGGVGKSSQGWNHQDDQQQLECSK
jgi:putative membrane protein